MSPVTPSARRLADRVNYLVRLRRLLTPQAAPFVLDYYRRERRMPPSYVLRLLPSTTVNRLRLRGEVELLLGIPSIHRFSRILFDRVIDPCRHATDAWHRRQSISD